MTETLRDRLLYLSAQVDGCRAPERMRATLVEAANAISEASIWVSVKDRLPEPETKDGRTADFVPVLFALNKTYMKRVCAGRYFLDTAVEPWESLQGSRYERREVTHWMNLPEPPK